MSCQLLIHVCSPLRATYNRSMARHLADAERYEAQVFEAGHLALTPHLTLTRHLDDTDPRQRARGIELALRYLDRADEVWVFGPRFSEGMKGELMYASCTGKPIVWYPSGAVCPDGIRLDQGLLALAFREGGDAILAVGAAR